MNFFRKHDWIITIVTWALVALSITTIYSITYSAETAIQGAGTANKQFIFALIGLAVYFGISFFLDYTYLKSTPILAAMYAVIVGLLILVLIISSANRGSVRWISLGFFNLEPSELAKILVIIAGASSFEKNLTSGLNWKSLVLKLLLFVPIIGLVFIQPNLSMTLSLSFILGFIFISSISDVGGFAIKCLAGALSFVATTLVINDYHFFDLIRLSSITGFLGNYRWIIFGVILFILILIVLIFRAKGWLGILFAIIIGAVFSFGYYYSWNYVLKDYQKDRINTFMNPEEDPLGDGYQVNQSMIAAGSGQIWGRGFGRGTQSNLNFLPERHTDFIFASYAEEFGFVGSFILIGLYIVLMIKIIHVGVNAGNRFGFLICIGVAAMIFFQFTVNVGMNIGIMPVTGVTLPLFSYGGSSLVVTLVGIALVQSVAKGRDLIEMENSLVVRER